MTEETCEWREDRYSYWHTECGAVVYFIGYDSEENEYMKCPYCRLELFVVDYVGESDAE